MYLDYQNEGQEGQSRDPPQQNFTPEAAFLLAHWPGLMPEGSLVHCHFGLVWNSIQTLFEVCIMHYAPCWDWPGLRSSNCDCDGHISMHWINLKYSLYRHLYISPGILVLCILRSTWSQVFNYSRSSQIWLGPTPRSTQMGPWESNALDDWVCVSGWA